MSRLFLDTETIGLHGPIVLLQYAVEDGDIQLYEPWLNPVERTLELFDFIATHEVIGFNLKFDWFHLQQMYTTLLLYLDTHCLSTSEIDVEKYAKLEANARDLGCLKPAGASDVMLLAQKSKFQSLMDRRDIIIRRVPTQLAHKLVVELNRRLPFDPIYFDRRKIKSAPVWQLQECHDVKFKNVVCRFKPSSRLKALAKSALGLKDDPILLSQIAMEDWKYPFELGYAPFASAMQKYAQIHGFWHGELQGKRQKDFKPPWYYTWPEVVQYHIDYWRFFTRARQYAYDDVHYTRELYKYFGSPEPNDDDSILTCLVGAVRWRGFNVDLAGIQELKDEAIQTCSQIPTAPAAVKRYLATACTPIEALALPDSTDKESLEALKQWKKDCAWCGNEGCGMCEAHDAAILAEKVLDARHAEKRIQLYNKLLIAERLHVSLKITGTKSNRMSGDDDLNAQAINKEKKVRSKFPLAFPPYDLSGADFDAFEVAIAAAVYNDPKLYNDLTTTIDCVFCDGAGCKKCSGLGKEPKKIHAIFGTFIYPGETYKSLRLSAGTAKDLYTLAKSGFFTWLFAGTEYSFEKRLGVPREQAKNGLTSFNRFYPEIEAARNKTMEDFRPLTQPEGPGTRIEWHEPKEYVETLLGFRRYFDLEYQTIQGLFELAQNPPEEWKSVLVTVARRNDMFQTVTGATQSALYGAAFALQNYVARAAINHPIQGTGAQITKRVERKLWDVQPSGYNAWRVVPVNIHDEIMAQVHPDWLDQVAQVVDETVTSLKSVIPLLRFDWKKGLKSWADK